MVFLIYTYLCVCTMAFRIYFLSAISNVCLSHAGGLMRRDLFIVFVRCAIKNRSAMRTCVAYECSCHMS